MFGLNWVSDSWGVMDDAENAGHAVAALWLSQSAPGTAASSLPMVTPNLFRIFAYKALA